MKALFKTLGLGALLAFAFMPGLIRAQYAAGNDDQMSQYGNAVAQNDENNVAPNDNASAPNASVPQNGDNSVSFQTFYDQLANQGRWIQTDKYGYVFQPRESGPNWRPYTYGHWVHTDAGMTWASDEPFGWATYHYGRWVNLDGTGWVWVPGYTWAPAWVSWRDNDDYVGWAPLPPETEVGIDFFDPGFYFGFGFHIGDDCDLAFGIGPWCYNFCPVAFIGDPFCWRHFRDPRDNFAFIGQTRNITNINAFNDPRRGVFNRVSATGPSVAALNARSTTRIQEARLTQASSLRTAGLRGNTLAAFAPRVDPATVKTARPNVVSGRINNANVNRGTNINTPLTGANGVRTASATSQQIQAVQLAQGNAVSGAKIAGVGTQPSRPLTRSLTSLQTTAATTGGVKSHAATTSATGSAFTGTHNTVTPSRNAESAFTGAGASRHTVTPSANASAQATYTGAPTTRHTLAPARSPEAAFTGAPTTRHTVTSSSSAYRQSSASAFHTSTPSYYHQSSAPTFHSSAPAYHPQSSFHSYAPAAHYSAPAAHYSGGGFSGGGGGRSGHR